MKMKRLAVISLAFFLTSTAMAVIPRLHATEGKQETEVKQKDSIASSLSPASLIQERTIAASCKSTDDVTIASKIAEPYDPQQLLNRLEAEMAILRNGIPGPRLPAPIGIIDSGILGFEDGPFFDERHFVPAKWRPNDRDTDGNDYPNDMFGTSYAWLGKNADAIPPGRDGSIKFLQRARNSAHGTQMASVILGGPNFIRNYPGLFVRLKVYNVSDPGGEDLIMEPGDSIGEAINYLMKQDVRIVNMSWQTEVSESTRENIAEDIEEFESDALFIIAAGNKWRTLPEAPFPAELGGARNVITVGAATGAGVPAPFRFAVIPSIFLPPDAESVPSVSN